MMPATRIPNPAISRSILTRSRGSEFASAAPTPPKVSMRTRCVMGFDLVDETDLDRVVEAVLAPVEDDERIPILATPNTDDLVRLARPEHAELAAWLARARFLLPDGQPVVWASRLLGTPLRARLTGADLIVPLWQRMLEERLPFVVVAPDHDVARRLDPGVDHLSILVPGRFDPGSPKTYDVFGEELLVACRDQDPRLVILGIGFPHQQHLARILYRRLGADMPLTALLGGSLDLLSGRTRRAPRWMRDRGLEWAFRLARDPRRLARRYLWDDPAFLGLVVRHWWAGQRHRGATTIGSRP